MTHNKKTLTEKSRDQNPVTGYDFTITQKRKDESIIPYETVKILLEAIGRQWAFQLEKGDNTGHMHYQGRLRLKERKRLNQVKILFSNIGETDDCPGVDATVSITSTDNSKNMFYVTKDDTRIAGPWKDTDPKPLIIPRQYQGERVWRPFQEDIMKWCFEEQEDDRIHYIMDPIGQLGKTQVGFYHGCRGLISIIPPMESSKDIMQAIMGEIKIHNGICPKAFIMDIPRAEISVSKAALFSAVETIKSGFAIDGRNTWKRSYFDSPQIIVYGNVLPDFSLLTMKRWIITGIDDRDFTTFNWFEDKIKRNYVLLQGLRKNPNMFTKKIKHPETGKLELYIPKEYKKVHNQFLIEQTIDKDKKKQIKANKLAVDNYLTLKIIKENLENESKYIPDDQEQIYNDQEEAYYEAEHNAYATALAGRLTMNANHRNNNINNNNNYLQGDVHINNSITPKSGLRLPNFVIKK